MKADRQAPIGVFDSGVGGLTVVREIMRNLPDERIVYFGDTARVPYGSKSKNTVIRYSRQIVHFLETQQVKAIVIACNTASAYALPDIEKEIDIPIIGVVRPGAKVAAQVTQNGKVGHFAPFSKPHQSVIFVLGAKVIPGLDGKARSSLLFSGKISSLSGSIFPKNLAFPNPYLFKHPKRKRPMRQKDA